jgi:glutathione S-transferase
MRQHPHQFSRVETTMIEVYAFATPNSVRVPIALEELGLAYELKPINVRKGEQKLPDYLAIKPQWQGSSVDR